MGGYFYLGDQTAELIGSITVKALGHEITDNINDCDVLLSVHHRKIIPNEVLSLPRIASINVHPYLYCYKGADPIGRAIKEKNTHASVGCHIMTDKVDMGRVITEMFFEVKLSDNRCEVYNQMYIYYVSVIQASLNYLEGNSYASEL